MTRQAASICRRPEGRFIAVAAILTALFLLAYRDELLGRLLFPLAESTATAAARLLHLLGMEAVQAGTRIEHPSGFACEIYYRCTGVLPAALFAILTIAGTAPFAKKCAGLAAGIPALLCLNLVRLVHLFYVGVHCPEAFDFTHRVLWEMLLFAATFACWWIWLRWASKR
jgi:exosortase/archaeosortase family protein